MDRTPGRRRCGAHDLRRRRASPHRAVAGREDARRQRFAACRALTTIDGQLVSVYEYPQAVLLVLGSSTLAAVAVGFVYGKGKRAWCRHLCPVNGVFALLAKVAPLHYRVDEDAWKRFTASVSNVDWHRSSTCGT